VSPSDLPPLDCHAHIAPDVTPPQIVGLKGALVFAMTRTPEEAHAAARRTDDTLAWGFGAHPGLPAALGAVDDSVLARAVAAHAVIGEVGLDRRGPYGVQRGVLEAVLTACSGRPVLLSLHSTGRTRELLDVLTQQPHPGAILHWFNGSSDEIAEAIELGCYFSVNHAMTNERLDLVPQSRMLPETDFPSSRRKTLASKPGDTMALEARLAQRDGVFPSTVRRGWYRNLGRLIDSVGGRSRFAEPFQRAVEAAAQQ